MWTPMWLKIMLHPKKQPWKQILETRISLQTSPHKKSSIIFEQVTQNRLEIWKPKSSLMIRSELKRWAPNELIYPDYRKRIQANAEPGNWSYLHQQTPCSPLTLVVTYCQNAIVSGMKIFEWMIEPNSSIGVVTNNVLQTIIWHWLLRIPCVVRRLYLLTVL